jgi:hypothetical protein
MATGDVGIILRMDPSKTLDMNIAEGIKVHYKRTGVPAKVVDVHPDDFKHHFVSIPGVEIRQDNGCLLHELFIGVCAKNAQGEVKNVKQ